MANKHVAVFLVCIAIVAALHIQNAEAEDDAPKGNDDKYEECFNSCNSECKASGYGDTLCEMKCGSKCTAKEAADKLGIVNMDK